MKRKDAIQIGEIIRQAIEESGNKSTYDAQHICYLWPEAVGPTINRYTTARWVHHDELHVVIASGVVKSEIAFMSDAIMARLHELAGMEDNPVVRRIVVH